MAGRDIANFGDIVILDDEHNKLQVNMCGGTCFSILQLVVETQTGLNFHSSR